MIAMALPTILLYEAAILRVDWVEKQRAAKAAASAAGGAELRRRHIPGSSCPGSSHPRASQAKLTSDGSTVRWLSSPIATSAKAAADLAKHTVSFQQARDAFHDLQALDELYDKAYYARVTI